MRAVGSMAVLWACAVLAQDGGSPFAGTWKIDLAACSDLTPVFDRYQPGFVVRKLSGVVAPVDTITWKGTSFDLDVKAVVLNLHTTVHLDGKTPTTDAFFGNPYTYTSVLEGGVVVSHGTITLPDGSKDRFQLQRTIAADGAMITLMTIDTQGGKPLVVKRVLRRQ